MTHRIQFYVTDEEYEAIQEYCRRKRRWRTPADLARDALWQLSTRNPLYVKKGPRTARKGADGSGPQNGDKGHSAVLRSGSQGNSQGGLRCEKQETLVSVRGLAPLTPER